MTITGRMTFTSEKSMEIKVVADVENLFEGKVSSFLFLCSTMLDIATVS